MNLKFEKKEYVAPKLSFIDMRGDLYLLSGSREDGPDAMESDDEFGFNLNEGADRIA
jgi:hypothetical protein